MTATRFVRLYVLADRRAQRRFRAMIDARAYQREEARLYVQAERLIDALLRMR